jgi:hypothetical protein
MPTTIAQHERALHQPAFCELLPVRDILHDIIVRTTGALVAGYELGGINAYYHSDEGRNRTKTALEALIRSLPERSMRMQMRFEITEGLGDVLDGYKGVLRNENPTLLALDRAGWNPGFGGTEKATISAPCYTRTFIGTQRFITNCRAEASAISPGARAARDSRCPRTDAFSGHDANMRTSCRNSARFFPGSNRLLGPRG